MLRASNSLLPFGWNVQAILSLHLAVLLNALWTPALRDLALIIRHANGTSASADWRVITSTSVLLQYIIRQGGLLLSCEVRRHRRDFSLEAFGDICYQNWTGSHSRQRNCLPIFKLQINVTSDERLASAALVVLSMVHLLNLGGARLRFVSVTTSKYGRPLVEEAISVILRWFFQMLPDSVDHVLLVEPPIYLGQTEVAPVAWLTVSMLRVITQFGEADLPLALSGLRRLTLQRLRLDSPDARMGELLRTLWETRGRSEASSADGDLSSTVTICSLPNFPRYY